MSAVECIARVQEVVTAKLGRPLKDDEIKAVFRRAQRFIKAGEKKGHDQARIQHDLEEFAQDVVSATIIMKRNAVFNVEAQVRTLDTLNTIFAEAPDVGLEAMMVGIQRDVKTTRASLGRDVDTAQDRVRMNLTTELEAQGVGKLFSKSQKGELDVHIFRAMDELHNPLPKFKNIPDDAVTIAKIIDKHLEMQRTENNQFGAWTKRERGYVTKRSHDPIRMARDKEGWFAFMRSHLDPNRSFPDRTGAEIDKILVQEYSQLVSGNHISYQDSLRPTGFEGFGSTARSLSHDRVFHFKTPDAEIQYLKQFGSGNLASSVFNTLANNARDGAIMKRFGPNARSNIDVVIGQLEKKHNGDPDMLSRLKTIKAKINDSYWPELSGRGNTLGPGKNAHIIATVDHTVRSMNRLSLLSFLIASQIPDLAIFASRVNRDGRGFTTGIIEAIDGLVGGTGLSKVDRMDLLSGLSVAVDGAIASVSRRMDINDHMAGTLTSMEQAMFKYTGAQGWTDRLRSKFAVVDSHMMALQSKKAFSDLNPDYQRTLRQQGVLPEEWDMLKHMKKTLGDNKEYVDPRLVDQIPDEVIDAELTRIGVTPTPRRRSDFRVHTRDKFQGYFQDRAGEAVLEPDAKTRSFVKGGALGRVQEQGTGARVLTNQFFALKTFPLAILQRVMGSETLGRSTDLNATKLDAFFMLGTNGSAFQGVAKLMVTGTILGYAALAIKDMVKGRKPRHLNDLKAWTAAMLQGGGLGIYGDVLFGNGLKNRFGNNPITAFAGPGVQDAIALTNIFGKWTGVVRGDKFDPAGDELSRFVQNNLPFAGNGPLRTALDYMFLYELNEAMNPGYLRRMERRMKRDNDQEFFLSPTSAAR